MRSFFQSPAIDQDEAVREAERLKGRWDDVLEWLHWTVDVDLIGFSEDSVSVEVWTISPAQAMVHGHSYIGTFDDIESAEAALKKAFPYSWMRYTN